MPTVNTNNKGGADISFNNATGKIYTVTTTTQAADHLVIVFSNQGGSSFTFDSAQRDKGGVSGVPVKGLGTPDSKVFFGNGIATSNNFSITVTDKSTNQPVRPLVSVEEIQGSNGSALVTVVTLVVEDRPGQTWNLDYNDVYVSFTLYEYRG